MEEALALKDIKSAKLEMMPLLAMSAGYLDRDRVYGSSSLSLITGRQSLEPSTSQDTSHEIADIRTSWNLLDFGVSYLQAKQNVDRYQISRQARTGIMLNLLQQVRGAFWRAAVMQQFSDDTNAILDRVKTSLADLETVRKEQLRAPINVLNDIRALLEIMQQLEQMQDRINAAQVELATLINVPPGSHLDLVVPEEVTVIPDISENIDAMEITALMNSSEYISQAYAARIESLESRKSLLRLLPGIEFSYGQNYDSNSFLVNNVWGEAGIRISENLMQLFFIDQIRDYNNVREELVKARRLAINMAVVTRLHLSWQNYQNTVKRLRRARQLSEVDQEISELTRGARNVDATSGVNRIQNDIRAFRSSLEHMLTYAEAQDAFGIFVQSLGLNPVPDDYLNMGIEDLTHILEDNVSDWDGFKLGLRQEETSSSEWISIVENPVLQPINRENDEVYFRIGNSARFMRLRLSGPVWESVTDKPVLPSQRSINEEQHIRLAEYIQLQPYKITVPDNQNVVFTN